MVHGDGSRIRSFVKLGWVESMLILSLLDLFGAAHGDGVKADIYSIVLRERILFTQEAWAINCPTYGIFKVHSEYQHELLRIDKTQDSTTRKYLNGCPEPARILLQARIKTNLLLLNRNHNTKCQHLHLVMAHLRQP